MREPDVEGDALKFKLWFTIASVVCGVGLSGTVFAFHSGGVGDCDGCHAMHNTPDAAVSGVAPGSTTGGPMLLAGSDQSSTCLNCHASNAETPSEHHVMTWPFAGGTNVASIPVNRTPGGDFSWLLLHFSYTSNGASTLNPGYGHGHNIVARDYGLAAHPTNTQAPGGTFPSHSLHCTSCHDPHSKMRRDSTGAVRNMTGNTSSVLPIIGSGSYPSSVPGATGATAGVTAPGPNQAVGVYRLLAGHAKFTAAGQTIPYAGVPMAIAPSTYNQTEATNQVRVAYGVGSGTNQVAWGAWCGTCHPAMLSGLGNHYHPVDGNAVLSASKTMTNYNQYVSSGNMKGSSATAYLSLVPFMTGSDDVKALALIADNTGTVVSAKQGPGSSAQVSCLSCHRAHASGFRSALRWNMEGEFITHVTSARAPTWPGTDTTPANPNYADGMLAAQVEAAYYDRPVRTFGAFQRSLCNKCHAQD
jgi:hypothetical protein